MDDQDAKRLYQQSVLQQSLEFDKQLVWLGAGAIALVVAFVTALKPEMNHGLLWSLGVGVFLLLASLTVTLASLQVSIADSSKILDGFADEDSSAEANNRRKDDRNRRVRRMTILNVTSLTTFAFGVVAFILFAAFVLVRG